MTEHTGFDEMRDRLPEYVLGALSADEARAVRERLGSDPDFAAELAVVRRSHEALQTVPRVDVARIVAALPAPPRPRVVGTIRPQSAWAGRGWRLAAASALLVAGLSYRALRQPVGGSIETGPTLTLGGTVVAVDTPVTATTTEAPRGVSFGGGMSDLSDAQLQTLLNDIERIETLPAAEPEAVLTTSNGTTESSLPQE